MRFFGAPFTAPIFPGKRWLESRSGEEERQHGENGYALLAEFVPHGDRTLQSQCLFYIDQLSASMAYGLLESGRGAE